MPWTSDNFGQRHWTLEFDRYRPEHEQWREVVLALGNGVWVQRAAASCAPRGDYHYPGTYRAGFYEQLESDIEGELDPTESLPNLPDTTRMSVRVEDGPWLDLDAAQLLDYCHGVSFRRGVSWREFRFVDASGRRTRWREQRLVSMTEPQRAAVMLRITAENWSGSLCLRSGIAPDIVNTNVDRYRGHQLRHLETLDWHCPAPGTLVVTSRTCRSGRRVAVGEALTLGGSTFDEGRYRDVAGEIAADHSCRLQRGQSVTAVKALVLVTDSEGDPPSQAVNALAQAPNFLTLYRSHCNAWRELWHLADVRVDHAASQLALRFHIFHLLQTISPLSATVDTGVPARGWHGEGYRGHIFWDELFALPFIFFRLPRLGRSLLLYRYRRLDAARAAASAAGLKGAMYPWRSAASGVEVTPRKQLNLLSGNYMDDPTYRQRHIGAAVAFNVWQYYLITGDRDFLATYGAEMICEIARFWASCAHWNQATSRYDIKGVVGPDEYHNGYPDHVQAGLVNNAYTNLMAAWTLCRALEVLNQLTPEQREPLRAKLRLDPGELTHWDHVSRNLSVEIRGDGVIDQFKGFGELAPLPQDKIPDSLSEERLDWALEAVGDNVNHYQAVKQADTLVALYLLSIDDLHALLTRLGYDPQRVDLLRTANYYCDITTHGSTLSEVVYAGALARLDLNRSWDFYRESLATDLEALRGESGVDGVHLGAMGGTLEVLQRCYVGIAVTLRGLEITPNLPAALNQVSLRLCYRGQWLTVELDRETLTLRAGTTAVTLDVWVRGRLLQLSANQCLSIPLRTEGEASACAD